MLDDVSEGNIVFYMEKVAILQSYLEEEGKETSYF